MHGWLNRARQILEFKEHSCKAGQVVMRCEGGFVLVSVANPLHSTTLVVGIYGEEPVEIR